MTEVDMTTTEELWRDLCEKNDRTSPEEYPDMALITQDELVSILTEYGNQCARAPPLLRSERQPRSITRIVAGMAGEAPDD